MVEPPPNRSPSMSRRHGKLNRKCPAPRTSDAQQVKEFPSLDEDDEPLGKPPPPTRVLHIQSPPWKSTGFTDEPLQTPPVIFPPIAMVLGAVS